MILIKITNVNKNKIKIEDKIARYENTINYSGLICKCGSREFNYHSTYERNIIENNKEYKIAIKRVRCKNCGKTHALIPDFLMPYYQTSSKEIVKCVDEMVSKKRSTTELEKEKQISRQKLNQWRKRYIKIKNRIRETFGKLIKIDAFLDGVNVGKVYHNISPKFLLQMTT